MTNKTKKWKVKKLLHSLFYDLAQPSAYTSKNNVFKAARRLLSTITRADVDRWFEDQLTYTLRNFSWSMEIYYLKLGLGGDDNVTFQ